jgi:hypothetical protein
MPETTLLHQIARESVGDVEIGFQIVGHHNFQVHAGEVGEIVSCGKIFQITLAAFTVGRKSSVVMFWIILCNQTHSLRLIPSREPKVYERANAWANDPFLQVRGDNSKDVQLMAELILRSAGSREVIIKERTTTSFFTSTTSPSPHTPPRVHVVDMSYSQHTGSHVDYHCDLHHHNSFTVLERLAGDDGHENHFS